MYVYQFLSRAEQLGDGEGGERPYPRCEDENGEVDGERLVEREEFLCYFLTSKFK